MGPVTKVKLTASQHATDHLHGLEQRQTRYSGKLCTSVRVFVFLNHLEKNIEAGVATLCMRHDLEVLWFWVWRVEVHRVQLDFVHIKWNRSGICIAVCGTSRHCSEAVSKYNVYKLMVVFMMQRVWYVIRQHQKIQTVESKSEQNYAWIWILLNNLTSELYYHEIISVYKYITWRHVACVIQGKLW